MKFPTKLYSISHRTLSMLLHYLENHKFKFAVNVEKNAVHLF